MKKKKVGNQNWQKNEQGTLPSELLKLESFLNGQRMGWISSLLENIDSTENSMGWKWRE